MRSVNSLPNATVTDQEQNPQPKLCNSCTSPARISDEPGPSNQDTDNETDSDQPTSNDAEQSNSNKSKNEEETQNTSKSTEESKLEEVDLGIESWV